MSLWKFPKVRQLAERLTDGQGLVEYALLLILVAIVLIAILTILAPGLVNIYENILAYL